MMQCSRPYKRGGRILGGDLRHSSLSINFIDGPSDYFWKNLWKNLRIFAGWIQINLPPFLFQLVSLINVFEDYRRAFLIIPWTVLVSISGFSLLAAVVSLIIFCIVLMVIMLPLCALCVFPVVKVVSFLPDRYQDIFKIPLVAVGVICAVGLIYLPGMSTVGVVCLAAYLICWLASSILSRCFIRFREGEIDDFQHTCCQCLTQGFRDNQDFSFAKDACLQCKKRDEQWIWVGCGSDGHNVDWRRVLRESGEVLRLRASDDDIDVSPISFVPSDWGHRALYSNLPAALLMDLSLSELKFPMHLTELPSWTFPASLTKMDLSLCRCLETLPLKDILKLPQLKSLACDGCSLLSSVPHEVCLQGGENTLKFVKEVELTGKINNNITLFFVGEGEAGKTSVIMSLQSDSDRAVYIRTDHRTIGIDISEWTPQGDDMTFTFFDLAGQSVYLHTHHLFLLRRALYLIVWRPPQDSAQDMDSVIENIKLWLECLQTKVPGAFVMLIVTHIDLVDPDTLLSVCAKVKDAVSTFIDALEASIREGRQVIRLWEQGGSIAVNCLSGDGIRQLREEIIAFAKKSPRYRELLPSSWLQLAKQLKLCRTADDGTCVPCLSWEKYMEIAMSPPCSIPAHLMASVTAFLHDTGTIRYFGDVIGKLELVRGACDNVGLGADGEVKFGSGISTIRANNFCPPGAKGYYELEVLAELKDPKVGFCSTDWNRGNIDRGVGYDGESWGVDGQSMLRWYKGRSRPFGCAWRQGDVIGLACELPAPSSTYGRGFYAGDDGEWQSSGGGEILVSVNGDFSPPNGTAFYLPYGLAGLYPAFSCFTGKVRCNLGSDPTRPLRHAPPTSEFKPMAAFSTTVTDKTVYISPKWMMDVIKGLFRHERQALTDYFIQEQNSRMLRHTNRLIRFGLFHPDLSPFLWPEQDKSRSFWAFVRRKGKRESDLWGRNIVSTNVETDAALKLLNGFKLLGRTAGADHIAPGVLPPAMLPNLPSHYVTECPFTLELTYASLPPGAFHTIVVSISRQPEFFVESGSVYAEMRWNSEIAQLFFLKVQSDSLDQESGNCCKVQRAKEDSKFGWNSSCQLEWKARLSCISRTKFQLDRLIIRSSDDIFLNKILQEVQNMEQSYSGVVKLGSSSRNFLCWSGLEKTINQFFSRQSKNESNSRSLETVCLQNRSFGIVCGYVFDREKCLQKHHEHKSFDQEGQNMTCPDCKHSHVLFNLLTEFRTQESVPCPICSAMTLNKIPCYKEREPWTLNAGECRLKLTADASKRSVDLITCFGCLGAGRSGMVRIMDVISPDIFVSGYSVVDGHMHDMIESFLVDIEIEADVIISNRSKAFTPLVGIEKSRIVIVLLSDAYVQSATCREEFQAASRLCLPVVPILLQAGPIRVDEGSIFPFECWSGPGVEDREYWRHAQNISESLSFSIQRDSYADAFDWSYLRHFTPLLGEFGQSLPGLLAKATKAIKSRLHRQGKVQSFSDFSMLGVKLSFLDQFIKKCGGRSHLKGMSTMDVMLKWVKPDTEASKLSYCELLESQGLLNAVGTATWFYSHAWKYRFLDVVDAAKIFFSQMPVGSEEPTLWFDIFSVSQHKAGIRPFEWWSTVFINNIGSIGKVLMVMQPFDDSDSGVQAWVTLSRVWCVFELYSCEATLSDFHVTMTENMATLFRREMLCNDRAWLKSLVSLDCEQSEATEREDKERVFDVIRRTIGFPLINSLVMRVIEKWLSSNFLVAQRTQACQDYPQLVQTVIEVVEAFQLRRANMVGILKDHPDSLASLHTLACLYKEQGRVMEAKSTCEECLRARERVLGADHMTTLASKQLLEDLIKDSDTGSFFYYEGAPVEACLGFGENDPMIAPSLVWPQRVQELQEPVYNNSEGRRGSLWYGIA